MFAAIIGTPFHFKGECLKVNLIFSKLTCDLDESVERLGLIKTSLKSSLVSLSIPSCFYIIYFLLTLNCFNC